MFTKNTKSQSSVVRKIFSTALTLSMLSGFALTAFTSLNKDNAPKVKAATTVLYSTDFGFGANPGAAIAETDYSYNSTSNLSIAGDYNILNNSNFTSYGANGIWFTSSDHTGSQDGYMMVVNGITVPGKAIFKKNLSLNANTIVNFSYWLKNSIDPNAYSPSANPILKLEIRDSLNNLVTSSDGSDILPGNQWINQNLSLINSSNGTYEVSIISNQPNEQGNDFYLDDILITQEVIPTLGSTTATTVAPIAGTVGVTTFPTINMTGSNIPDNTVATFAPAGTNTVINGKIIGGNFVPDAGQVVPANATQGPSTGVLSTPGATSVNVPTNFIPVSTSIGCTQTNTADDNFDSPVQPNTLTDAGYPSFNILGTTFNGWSMQNGSIFNILKTGSIPNTIGPNNAQSGNQYVDVAGANDYLIKPFTVTSNGTITASAYFANWGVTDNNYKPWMGSVQILDSSYNVIGQGNQLPFVQSTDKDIWYQSTVSSVVLPSAGIYYIRLFVGDYGVVDTASYCITESPTLGSTTATTVAPIAGTVGVTTFPTINMTGSNIPDNTVATFAPAGTTTVINGQIIGGNFVPNAGQVVPASATQGQATGVLSTPGATSVNVSTNFTPVPPTATNDNYTANGTTPISITPLTGDTGAAIKIKSINGTAITPGTAQTIVTPSGTFAITAAGVITYTANLSYAGTATIPYVIEDVAGQTATANLIIAPSTAPTATNDNYSTVGTAPVTLLPLTGDTSGSVINSINGITLTPGTAQVIPVTGGNVNVSATGTIQFVANSGYTGNATFPYVIQAPNGVTATANQIVAISAPVISSSSLISSSSVTVSSSSLATSSSSLIASSSSPVASSSVLSSSSVIVSSSVVASSSSLPTSSSSVAMSSSVVSSSSAQLSSSSVVASSSVVSSSATSSSSLAMSSSSIATSSVVAENDGVTPTVENAAPNTGDANGDGIKDALQGNVASLPDTGATSKYVVVAADPTSPCQSLTNVATNTEVANVTLDALYDYPVGFVNFQSPCATSIKVKIYWYGLDVTKSYINRKFNSTTNTYADVPGITSSIETVNGVQVLAYTYTVTDNGSLDADSTVGNIKDPIGPVLAPTAAGNGGVITVGNQSSIVVSSSISSKPITPIVNATNPSNSTTTSGITLAVVDSTKQDSNTINTVRTGGESNVNFILFVSLILPVSLVLSTYKKTKRTSRLVIQK